MHGPISPGTALLAMSAPARVAAALVVAGMLSVLLFPMFAKIRLGPAHRTRPAEAESRLVSGVARAGLH